MDPTTIAHPGSSIGRTLVVVFLRGGADGLSLVPPVGDDDYHRARPRIAVSAKEGVALDHRFALHPCLAALEPAFHEGCLAVVPACGSDDDTRSHFEAQDLMEHGSRTIAGGWIGRWLRRSSHGESAALSALALGSEVPESLRSAPSATVLRSLDDLALDVDAPPRAAMAELYAGDDMLAASARDALSAVERMGRLRADAYRPERGAVYADEAFASGLRQIAQLVKAEVGVQAATIDLFGWDSHFLQATLIEPQMRILASGLAAFAADLGPRLATTSVVVMSEFGRRVHENSALGTDHGRGGALFVLGGGVRGGVHGTWPGLADGSLDGPGDVAVANDYRDVLAPVLARHGGGADAAFPGRAFADFAI